MAKRGRGRKRSSQRFDLPEMRRAIGDFLEAAGVPVEGTELEETPDRVARAWIESFLDGYEADPESILREAAYPLARGAGSPGVILLKDIAFHGLCPHHLLPYHGRAHIAYAPGRKLASLSSLTRLVDCFAHRLELQETVTHQIAEAITEHLGATGAACALESDQTCMTMRGVERKGTRTVTQHFTGSFAKRSDLRLEFLRSLESFQ